VRGFEAQEMDVARPIGMSVLGRQQIFQAPRISQR
jgi:hypothetical protein